MSIDPTPLQERIRRARSVPADWAKLREGESTREQIERHQARMDEQTAALIAAEVWKAQADALRQVARDLSWFGAQGNTLDHLSAWGVVQTCMKAIESTADRIEKKD